MAYIVSNAKFRPFSYSEMVAPLVQYKEAYDKAEADFSNLITQTEAWKDVANQTNNPVAYKMYKDYSDTLNNVASDFSRGMTMANRSALMGLKRGYASNIVPIARADAALTKEKERRDNILLKSPGAIFVDESPLNIDSFLNGKTPNGAYIDSDDIMKQAAADFQALGTAMFSNPEFRKVANGYQLQVEQLNGMRPEELFSILANPANATTEAGKAYRETWDRYAKYLNQLGPNGKQVLTSKLYTGALTGLAKPKYQYMDSGLQAAQANARGWAQINESQREFNAQMKARGFSSDGTIDLSNPIWYMKNSSSSNKTYPFDTPSPAPTEPILDSYIKEYGQIEGTKKYNEAKRKYQQDLAKHNQEVKALKTAQEEWKRKNPITAITTIDKDNVVETTKWAVTNENFKGQALTIEDIEAGDAYLKKQFNIVLTQKQKEAAIAALRRGDDVRVTGDDGIIFNDSKIVIGSRNAETPTDVAGGTSSTSSSSSSSSTSLSDEDTGYEDE